ncbi:MAG: hypothetical protein AB7N91_30350 [Candidatus Tectimicrobiota bacterium]
MEQATVLVGVDDLFFLSKIQTTLRHLGVTSQVVTQSAALQQHLQDTATPVLLVVDLTLRASDPLALIQAARAVERTAPLAILAFGAHVAVDSRQQALQAGADRVVVKSEFSQHLPTLIQQYLPQA